MRLRRTRLTSRGTEEHGRGRTATAQRHESGRQPGVSGLTNMASASAARLWLELVQRLRHLNPAVCSTQEVDPFLNLWRRTPKAFTASAIKRAVRGRLIIEYPCGKCGREATAEKGVCRIPDARMDTAERGAGIRHIQRALRRLAASRFDHGAFGCSAFDYNIRGDRVPLCQTLPSVAFTIGKAPASASKKNRLRITRKRKNKLQNL